MDNGRTCCFTGRRPKDLCGYNQGNYNPFIKELADYLEKLYDEGVRNFITGGAQGFDQMAFWAVDELRMRHKDVQNILYVPFQNQDIQWNKTGPFSRAVYQNILRKASSIHYVVDKHLTDNREICGALLKRNHEMVDDADFVIALYPNDEWKVSKGGTSECMRYADKHQKLIFQIKYQIENNILHFGEVTEIAPEKELNQPATKER